MARKPRRVRVFTIGHSTLPLDEFVGLLRAHQVQALADVRSLPGSRRFPQYNRETLEPAMEALGIEYVWLPSLGGHRKKLKDFDSPNTFWRLAAFRNYADYMLSDEFAAAVDELLALAARKTTAIMCAEALYWRCHRRLISDYLVAHGVNVEHHPQQRHGAPARSDVAGGGAAGEADLSG